MRNSELGISVRKTVMGKGVFATKKFRKDQVIGQMQGTVIPGDDYDPSYVVDLGRYGVLDPHAPFRFMNHCCDPNVALIEYPPAEKGAAPTIWVEALRTIQVGEQISIDYSWPADAAIRCLCGSPKCRGWVVSEADARKLRKLEQQKLAAQNPAQKSGKRAKKGSQRKAPSGASSAASKRAKTPGTGAGAAANAARPKARKQSTARAGKQPKAAR